MLLNSNYNFMQFWKKWLENNAHVYLLKEKAVFIGNIYTTKMNLVFINYVIKISVLVKGMNAILFSISSLSCTFVQRSKCVKMCFRMAWLTSSARRSEYYSKMAGQKVHEILGKELLLALFTDFLEMRVIFLSLGKQGMFAATLPR